MFQFIYSLIQMLYIFTQKTKFLHFQPKDLLSFGGTEPYLTQLERKRTHDFWTKLSAIV